MKKLLTSALCLLLILSLTGCGGYVSSYHAVGFVHSSTKSSAKMDFYSFEGRMVFQLRSADGGELEYTGSVESGSITVYLDDDGMKTELFSLRDSEEVSSASKRVNAGKIYVIVETDETCKNGSFRFDLKE